MKDVVILNVVIEVNGKWRRIDKREEDYEASQEGETGDERLLKPSLNYRKEK